MAKTIVRLVVALSFLTPSFLCAAEQKSVGEVLNLRGSVHVVRKAKKIKIKKGFRLKAQDKIITKEKSLCFIFLSNLETKLKIAENTQIKVGPRIEILEGQTWVRKKASLRMLGINLPQAFVQTKYIQGFIRVVSDLEQKVAIKSGEAEIRLSNQKADAVILSSGVEAYFKFNVPPIIIGLTKESLLNWEEPFEEY